MIEMARNKWPAGVKQRFLNRAGAPVDVKGTVLKSWRCSGCNDGSRIDSSVSADEMLRRAQTHANSCSAVAR